MLSLLQPPNGTAPNVPQVWIYQLTAKNYQPVDITPKCRIALPSIGITASLIKIGGDQTWVKIRQKPPRPVIETSPVILKLSVFSTDAAKFAASHCPTVAIDNATASNKSGSSISKGASVKPWQTSNAGIIMPHDMPSQNFDRVTIPCRRAVETPNSNMTVRVDGPKPRNGLVKAHHDVSTPHQFQPPTTSVMLTPNASSISVAKISRTAPFSVNWPSAVRETALFPTPWSQDPSTAPDDRSCANKAAHRQDRDYNDQIDDRDNIVRADAAGCLQRLEPGKMVDPFGIIDLLRLILPAAS